MSPGEQVDVARELLGLHRTDILSLHAAVHGVRWFDRGVERGPVTELVGKFGIVTRSIPCAGTEVACYRRRREGRCIWDGFLPVVIGRRV